MIRTLLVNALGHVFHGGEEQIAIWKSEPESRLWVDVQSEGHKNHSAEADLLISLGCHRLAIEDSQRDRHPPKLEDFDDHVFILYRGIARFDSQLNHEAQSLSFFVGARLLISYHPQDSIAVNHLLESNAAIQLQRSPAQLALRLMYTSAGIYLEHILTFEDNLSDLEDELLLHGSDEVMRQLMSYKSRLVKLRRIFNYHESITSELRNGEYELFSDTRTGLEHTLTDLHDRFERLNSLASLFYDICGDLIDGYLAVTSHQLNNTMRVLTVITAIFVPLSFLAGLYGMNFDNIPELHTHDGYFILLGVMAGIASGLLLWFRRLRWV